MAPSALTVLFAVCAAWDVPHALAQSLRGDQNVTRLSKTIAATEAGSCTAADETQMSLLGGGNAEGTFPRLLADCGKNSWSFFQGFNSRDFQICVIGSSPISAPCASCFAISVAYAYKSCKYQCYFGSWCSRSCLACVAPSVPAAAQCAGVSVPEAPPCE
mmetsp:Transcript_18144/g.31655  ORF Transcript_18144/g.31655 Transcript_18144/m.31655 type:complete len:160 (+) Transcript_18144:62-541(+)